MAGERTLPGLGLYGFWTLGSNGYKDQMDGNLRLVSALTQGRVISKLGAEPGSPSDGDIHIATAVWGGAAANDILIRDNGAWVFVTPLEGWQMYDIAIGEDFRFDGSAWVSMAVGAVDTSMVQSETTASRNVTNADLAGNKVVRVNSASAVSITVNNTLTGTEPCTFIGTGAGVVTFVAGSGVTINSADSNLALRGQFSSAALIPDSDNANTYFLLGDLG